MKNMKSIFLGSAIAVAAATGAQAADPILDVKAPREPVYRCDITGFIELPGTDICFKVGGFARAVIYHSTENYDDDGRIPYGVYPDPGFDPFDEIDSIEWYSVGRLNFDARTVTEYGTVRGFIEIQASSNNVNTGGSMDLRHAYVQFGNWTFGRTNSTFTHGASDPEGSDPFTIIGTNTMRRDQIRYTQAFGGGVTVSVALEDQAFNNPGALYANGIYAPAGFRTTDDKAYLPDVVANVNVSGNWGEVQLSGALHQNRVASYYSFPPLAASNTAAYADDDFGWAALFGLVLNTPMTGADDFFTLKAIYTDGASQYAGGNNALRSGFLTGTGAFGGGFNGFNNANTIWGDCDGGAIFSESICDTVKTWSVVGSFHHDWTPTVGSWIGAGYQNTQADNVYFDATQADFARDFDVDAWEVFAGVSWTPVSRTTFLVDVHYGAIDVDNVIFPATPGVDRDEEALAIGAQVTRSF